LDFILAQESSGGGVLPKRKADSGGIALMELICEEAVGLTTSELLKHESRQGT
jgi:hypothetical protein